MARVRSTARVTRDGEEAEAAETAPISEVMKWSGLVVPEDVSDEGVPTAEAEHVGAEEGESKDDYSVVPSKPSHLEFGRPILYCIDLRIVDIFHAIGRGGPVVFCVIKVEVTQIGRAHV